MNSTDDIRKAVIAYADNDEEFGWLTVHSNGRNYRVPKRAAIHYVMGPSISRSHHLPPYTAFAPSGMKLQLDDRNHSDVILGMGMNLEDSYCDEIRDVMHAMYLIIEKEYKEMISFDFNVLSNESDKTYIYSVMVYEWTTTLKKGVYNSIHIDCYNSKRDTVWAPCVVIPEASVEYEYAVKNAEVIITERGGPLSHLAILSREQGKVLIRIDNAVEDFPYFTKFSLDFNKLKLKLSST